MAKHDESKKRQERLFFELAQALDPELLPAGKVDATGENPDIVIDTGNYSYGVEVTELLDQPKKRVEGQRASILALAAKRLGDASLQGGLRVQVLFQPAAAIASKRERENAIEELLAVVRPLLKPSRETDWKGIYEGGEHSSVFSKVWVHFHPVIPHSHWVPIDAHWVEKLNLKSVTDRIEEKAPRIGDYRKRASRVYLLLVVYGFAGSSATTVDPAELLAVEHRSPFDEVLLLDCVMNKLTRLNHVHVA